MHYHTCACGVTFQCPMPCWYANEEYADCGVCPQDEPEEVESPAQAEAFEQQS